MIGVSVGADELVLKWVSDLDGVTGDATANGTPFAAISGSSGAVVLSNSAGDPLAVEVTNLILDIISFGEVIPALVDDFVLPIL